MMREMVIGDLLNLAMLKEVIEVEFIGTLWVEGDSGPMTPYVCEASFGDGMPLLTISTINQRPNYHVVRVHSGWDQSNWSAGENVGDHIDEILWAIEDECGRTRWNEDDRGDGRDERGRFVAGPDPWPAIEAEGGCCWGHIRWPWLMKEIGWTAMVSRIPKTTPTS